MGERFRFYYDIERADVLHITFRHGTMPDNAVQTFFGGEAKWDDAHARYETSAGRHTIYWARHAHDQSIIIISCFERGEV